jgi:hypothetical protein
LQHGAALRNIRHCRWFPAIRARAVAELMIDILAPAHDRPRLQDGAGVVTASCNVGCCSQVLDAHRRVSESSASVAEFTGGVISPAPDRAIRQSSTRVIAADGEPTVIFSPGRICIEAGCYCGRGGFRSAPDCPNPMQTDAASRALRPMATLPTAIQLGFALRVACCGARLRVRLRVVEVCLQSSAACSRSAVVVSRERARAQSTRLVRSRS